MPSVARPLTDEQVRASRRLHGDNQLTRREKVSLARQFLSNFGDPIIKILLAALAMNVIVLFRTADWYETVGIAAAILLATLVSTLSERGSEAAFEKLREEAARATCRVRRDGKLLACPVDEVVVGDWVLLSAGDRVPADGWLHEGSLRVDQSALNGESREAAKHSAPAPPPEDGLASPFHLFRGSVVCGGEGVLIVTRVGDCTFYGGMAREMQEESRESPLKVRLADLAKRLSRLGYLSALLIAVADLIHTFLTDLGGDPAVFARPADWLPPLLHAATLAITVVVVAVPEGLPMMITVVLSANMRRMLKDHVLVRKPVGIETSGSLNILFTDKTGTLTRGAPEVVCLVDGEGICYHRTPDARRQKAWWRMVTDGCVLNSESAVGEGGRVLGGNATDRALLRYVWPVSGETRPAVRFHLPFESGRKYSAVQPAEGPTHIKGAPEILLPRCRRMLTADGRVRPLADPYRLNRRLKELTSRAMRVLLLAASDTPVTDETLPDDLIFVALLGIRDDLRPEVPTAVRTCKQAGIQVVMITGDNRDTAAAIAREAGLLDRDDEAAMLDGERLRAMSDAELAERLPSLRVVSRTMPADKSRLVRIAQAQGLVVGMTGDGINDAPALKKADVGFAMGRGTEVAKEAGDVVILDDNFASITRAVLYGRTIFLSIRKFLVFQLTMNVCAVGVSLLGPFLGVDTPVTVMQMLWINIMMDTLAGLAFAGEAPLPETMREPPKRRDEPIISAAMRGQIVGMGTYAVALCLLFLCWPPLHGFVRPQCDGLYILTAFFALFIFTGVFNSFNARTPRLWLLSGLRKNRAFVGVMALVSVVQLLLIYLGGSLFRTAGLTLREWVIVLALAFTVIPADLLRKTWLRRQTNKKGR